MAKKIVINDPNEGVLIKELEKRTDIKAERIKRLLRLPDLTRKENSPVKFLFDQIINLSRFKDFDLVDIPRIVTVEQEFDLLNAPKEHPSRKETDTYYLDDIHSLRTQMTVFWSFYLKDPEILKKLEGEGELMALSRGIVYRKDEIDRHHFPAFHQIDGLYICKKIKKTITQKDLEEVLANIAKAVFGPDIKYRFNDDSFPYTYDSIEMEVDKGGKWVEVLGAGIAQPSVLEKLGVDSKIWGGWAFGFGLERLAIISMELPDIRLLWSENARVKKQLKLGNKFKDVSKYPPITRDISFVVNKDFIPNNYFDLIRDLGGDLVEQVELLDKYENAEKFGEGKISYAYRIIFRSNERTLITAEADEIMKNIYGETEKQFNAELR